MSALTAQDIVDLWDRGIQMGSASRALAILARAEPDCPPEEHGALKVGDRDAKILALREQTFGPELEVVTKCPSCDAWVGLTFTTAEIFGETGHVCAWKPVARNVCGHTAVLRPVTAADLSEIEEMEDIEDARLALLARCVISIDGEQGKPVTAEIAAAIEQALETLDDRATSNLDTSCPGCGFEWSVPFDPPTYFWEEIEVHATRLLAEVAALAARCHWSEREILAMSAARRRFYLEAMGS